MKIYELFQDPQKLRWGAYAHDSEGVPCDPLSPNAVSWCLRGATIALYGKEADRVYAKLARAVSSPDGPRTVVNAEQVVALAKKADV